MAVIKDDSGSKRDVVLSVVDYKGITFVWIMDVNTNNVKNVICIIRSLYVLIITKYKNTIRKVTFNKFLIEKTRFDNVSTTTSLQV